METYNELLKEFHEELSPKTFTLQYKSLYDELTLHKTRKKTELKLKKQELRHQRQGSPKRLNSSSISFVSLSQNTKMTSSRLEVSSIGESQLKRQYTELQFQVKSLKARTIQITNQLKIFENRQEEIKQTNKFNNFSVFNHYQQVIIQANTFNNQEMKVNHVLHVLKSRKEQLKEQIDDLVKKKQTADNLRRRLIKAKESKILKYREPQHQTSQFLNILRTFDILSDLCQSYESEKEVKVEEFEKWYNKENSKKELIREYYHKGHPYDQATAMKIVGLYRKLQANLDCNQRAHRQATQSLSTLEVSHDNLTSILRKIHERKERYSITALRQYYTDLQHFQQGFQFNCNKVNKFTSQLYQFLKKFNAYINTLEHILEQTKVGKRIMEIFPDCKILKQYEEHLYRNPQELTLSFKSCELYMKDIKKNNLFRIYYLPENISTDLDELQNYQKLITIAFKKANEFIFMMFKMISQYFKIMKNQKRITSSQKNNENYCIESKDYYRRDNFKLLQKMQNQQLKRKGLLMKIPINVVFDSEIDEQKASKTYTSSRSLTPRCSAVSRTLMKYTDLASKREEHSIKKQKIRKLFGKLQSIERIPANFSRYKPQLQSSRLTVTHSSSNLSIIRSKVLCKTRKTVGILSKQNMPTQFPE